MRALILIAAVGACVAEPDPEWQLDHDRVVAVRATPPHVPSGQAARLDALIAHKGAPTDVAEPAVAAAALAPDAIAGAVQLVDGHWQVVAPDAAALASARAQLQLADGAAVPLAVVMQFTGGLDAKKTVWLGDARDNPASVGTVMVGGMPAGPAITMALDTDVTLAVDAPADDSVMWLTSVGEMHDDNEVEAFVHVDPKDRDAGELVLVVRDNVGGVVWQVWPAAAR
jgi:hypothetical protein